MPQADFFALFRLFLLRDFLDADCCARLRNEVRSGAAEAGMIWRQGEYLVDEEVRLARSVRVPAPAVSLVTERLQAVKPMVERHFSLTLAGCQDPLFLAYKTGDYYRPHCDGSNNPDDDDSIRQRRVSVIVFLNGESDEPREDCFGGGALTFYRLLQDRRATRFGIPLVGERGLLIAFPPDLIHEVRPVTHGERFTVVSWFF